MGVYRTYRMWGIGCWSYRVKSYPHYKVVTVAVGPYRFKWKDLSSRWREYTKEEI